MWNNIFQVSVIFVVLIILMLAVYYVVNFRTLKKQRAYFQKLQEELAVGQNIIFLNGIYGTITNIKKETVDVRVKSGAEMQVSRFAVSRII